MSVMRMAVQSAPVLQGIIELPDVTSWPTSTSDPLSSGTWLLEESVLYTFTVPAGGGTVAAGSIAIDWTTLPDIWSSSMT